MAIITDEEFGEIVVKKRSLAKSVSLKIAPDGRIQITMPPYAPLLAAKALIKTSRKQIRELVFTTEKAFLHEKSANWQKPSFIATNDYETFKRENRRNADISRNQRGGIRRIGRKPTTYPQ